MTMKTNSWSTAFRAAGLMPVLVLAACTGSQRFDSAGYAPQTYGQPMLQPAPPIESAPVMTQPLPPPGGYPSASAPGSLPPPQDPYYEPAPGAPQISTPPPVDRPSDVPTLRGGGGQIATLGAGTGSARGAVSSRDGVIGNWTAREATGTSCRVQLSSAPSLDLYRANASGCANRDLQKVNAWDFRDGEVYLYQQGGSVVARLRASDGGAMNGAVTKSGAALSLNR
ncbi:AprI/Inh family metalloprotease inhibitor [Bosea sp. PAMC 26642]|uniref:AprI/Inh family metalloprotease inhibitor n=1 Tax=Bosea sp. (strain PAMC 26642) TaxID=1792307 RepID=UPI001F403AE6|nr:AprI/Inh family metalloprotease inhibitor [Bosea sp. PAMC 26642]